MDLCYNESKSKGKSAVFFTGVWQIRTADEIWTGGPNMKLSFLGAAHEVTGSCHYLQACGKKILIDCGMQQGPD